MKKKAFRAYDIRGVVGEDFSIADIIQLGKAFASLLRGHKHQKVIIGRDGRFSSPNLSEAFIEGLMSSGVTVLDCGLVPTPLLYFSAHHAKADGAVMVTGSHNPPEHNGFKMMLKEKPLCGAELQKLHSLLKNKKFRIEKGSRKKVNYTNEYLDFLLRDFQQNYGTSALKVAWDTGDGAAGPILKKLLHKLPGTHYHINESVDGFFPAHPPDPTEPDNVKQLAYIVKEKKCDFGIAFDGDGDRLSVVDPEGQLIWADQLLPIFAEEVLATHPGAFILADVKSSYLLKNIISNLGGNFVLCPCGHSQIKIKMKEIHSPLACEMSGHIMFADRALGFDDAIYAALRLFGIFSNKSLTFKEWLDLQPKSFKSKAILIPSKHKFQKIKKLKDYLKSEDKHFADIDGIRVETKEGWWLIRASNTEEHLVVRIEASTYKGFMSLLEKIKYYLEKTGIKNLISLALDKGYIPQVNNGSLKSNRTKSSLMEKQEEITASKLIQKH